MVAGVKHVFLFATALVWLGCSSGGNGGTGGGSGGPGGGAGGGSGSVIDPQQSTVTVDPAGPLVADNSAMAQVHVTVKDTGGKPVAQVPVAVALSGDGGQVTQVPSTQNDGTTSATVSSSVAEVKTITVTAGSPPVTLASMPTLTFVAGLPSGVFFDVQPPASVKAGEVIAPAVHLQVVDVHGNLAPTPPTSVALRLVWDSTGGTLTGGDLTDSVDGGLTFAALTINRPQAGYALRAEVMTGPASGAADESQKFDVTVGDVAQATSSLTASPVNVVADGSSTTTLTVTLMDLGLNPVSGQSIALSVTGTGNTLGATSGTSDATGTFSTTLASTVNEVKTVTATAGAVQLTTQVTFIP